MTADTLQGGGRRNARVERKLAFHSRGRQKSAGMEKGANEAVAVVEVRRDPTRLLTFVSEVAER